MAPPSLKLMAHVRFKPDTSTYDWIVKNAVHYPNGQTLFSCPWHGPARGAFSGAPEHGDCPGCWILFCFRLEAATPPDQREALFANLNRLMEKTVRLAEKGDFDLQMDAHPRVEVTLDPTDIDHLRSTP